MDFGVTPGLKEKYEIPHTIVVPKNVLFLNKIDIDMKAGFDILLHP